MKSSITISAVAAAVIVLVVSGSVAYGANPWDDVWAAIEGIRAEIASIELTPGPQGPQGEQGPSGVAGMLNLYQTVVTANVLMGDIEVTTAECRPGDQVISGGFITGHTALQVTESQPSIAVPQGWRVGVYNPHQYFDFPVSVFAWCSDVTP